MVQNPFRLVGQTRAGVQADNLVILAGEVMPAAVHVGNLHKKTCCNRLANVGVVLP